MQYVIYGFIAFGEIVVEFIKKYWPKLIAKFGWQALALGIQKVFSVIIITMVTSFWVGFIAFVVASYIRVSDFIAFMNSGNGINGSVGGVAGSSLQCIWAILQASGLEAGVTSALPFLMAVIIFVMSTVLYTVTKELLVVIGNELAKHLDLLTK
ncbi:MAG: hypothetical protein JZU49_06025 [Sulfuricurvum sp.]|nr:hypothetical protein [Sulfuricurvum sp.]